MKQARSDDYDYVEIADQVFSPIYPDIAEMMVQRTGIRSGRLLDVGCGPGHMGFAVMDLGDFTGDFCDIHPTAVKIAKERVEERGLSDRVSVCEADVHDLPYPAEVFDLIVSRGSMFFWEDQREAFSELFRVLKPGGWAYIGGGLGGKKHAQRIRALKEEGAFGLRSRKGKRDDSNLLKPREYIELFEQWGCRYRLIRNEDEGHWILFGKKANG